MYNKVVKGDRSVEARYGLLGHVQGGGPGLGVALAPHPHVHARVRVQDVDAVGLEFPVEEAAFCVLFDVVDRMVGPLDLVQVLGGRGVIITKGS